MKFQDAEKLSDLLEIAQTDLKAIEKDERYTVNMVAWHSAAIGGKCAVCMAGAVMARSLKTPYDISASPFNGYMDVTVSKKLHAINYARSGDVLMALTMLGGNESHYSHYYLERPYIVSYHSNSQAFHTGITDLIANLRGEGL